MSPEEIRDCILARSSLTTASEFREGLILTHRSAPSIAQFAEIEREGDGAVVKIYSPAWAKTFTRLMEHCI